MHLLFHLLLLATIASLFLPLGHIENARRRGKLLLWRISLNDWQLCAEGLDFGVAVPGLEDLVKVLADLRRLICLLFAG